MEHGTHWSDDVLPRGCGQHPGAAGLARQVREQDSDAHQDRLELKDAEPFPAGCVLYAKGAGRSGNVVDGSRAYTAVGFALVQADRCGDHPFQVGICLFISFFLYACG